MALSQEPAVTDDTIKPLQVTAEQLADQVTRVAVTDEDSLSKAGDLYKIIMNQIKKGDESRTSLVKPLNDHVKWINNQFKPLTTQLTKLKNEVKAKMDVFVSAKRKLELEEAAKVKKAAEDEALKLAAQLEKAGNTEAAANVVEAAAALPDTVPKAAIARGNYGSSTATKSNWNAEIVDMKAFLQAIIDGHIPEDFIEVKQAKLTALAVSRKVEKTNFGIKISQTFSASVR